MISRFPEKPGNSLSSSQALYASDAVSGTIARDGDRYLDYQAISKMQKKIGDLLLRTQNPDLMVLMVKYQVGDDRGSVVQF